MTTNTTSMYTPAAGAWKFTPTWRYSKSTGWQSITESEAYVHFTVRACFWALPMVNGSGVAFASLFSPQALLVNGMKTTTDMLGRTLTEPIYTAGVIGTLLRLGYICLMLNRRYFCNCTILGVSGTFPLPEFVFGAFLGTARFHAATRGSVDNERVCDSKRGEYWESGATLRKGIVTRGCEISDY